VVLAEDKKETKKEEKKPVPFANVFSFPKQIKLTEDQQKKLDQLRTEYTSQLEVNQKKYTAIMTPDRQKAGQEASKQAKADGKKGKELAEAVQAAYKFTDDEKKQLKDIGAERSKLIKEINTKKTALLTDEQKEQLKPKPKTEKKPTDK
jgi:hypothetical protein